MASRLTLALLLLSLGASSSEGDSLPRIRGLGHTPRALLQRGYTNSPTFRQLVDRIEASDVIVHVTWTPSAHDHLSGSMQFVSYSGGYRFVRVQIRGTGPMNTVVALLAHELQHVGEIVAAPWVMDQASVGALYLEIGEPSCAGPGICFDTAAARAAGGRVLRELRQQTTLAASARD